MYGSILPNILSIAGIFTYYLHDEIAGILLWASRGYMLAKDPSLPVKKNSSITLSQTLLQSVQRKLLLMKGCSLPMLGY